MIKKVVDYLFLSAYLLLPVIHTFDAVDRMGAQWFYLAILNFLGLIYVYFNFDIPFFKRNLSNFRSPLFLFFSLLVWMILSSIMAINFIESTVVLSRWLNVVFAIVIVSSILKRQKKPFEVLSYLFSGFVILEVSVSILQFFDVIENLNQQTRNTILGFAANKNINAASILFKLPFLLFLSYKIKFPLTKIVCILFSTLALISIISIGARSMILALFLIYLLLVAYLIIKIKNTNNYKPLMSKLLHFFIPLFLGIGLSNILIRNSSMGLNTNIERIVDYGSTQSATDRLRYFEQAITNFIENPILGSGIGNWKIKSIKYDSLDMNNYVVQYNVHNDFLELFAEIGLGGLFYISIYLIVFISLIKWFFRDKFNFKYVIIGLSFLVYFIDSLLNFPMMRVITQVNFILIISLFILIQDKIQYVEK